MTLSDELSQALGTALVREPFGGRIHKGQGAPAAGGSRALQRPAGVRRQFLPAQPQRPMVRRSMRRHGRSTGMAAWVWRLIFAALFICAGAGLLLYVLLWIFVPSE